jgi:hypothetical protein
MWLGTVIGMLMVVLLVVLINKVSKEYSSNDHFVERMSH